MKKGIIGAGGFGREVYWSLNPTERNNTVFFVDDEYWDNTDNKVLPLSKFNPSEYELVIAIADSKAREKIVNNLPKNTKYFTHIHPSVQIHGEDVIIGEGSIICAGSIITTNVKIGKHAHINLITTIGHDCVIGDYFTTAPGVQISGNETIGNRVYFGTRSCIKQKLIVCDDVTIGMNAGVTKNIIESGVYVGTPQLKLSDMKDLISVFAYAPDNERKKVLQDLLIQLQPIRNMFDIMVVAHSPITELSYDNIDYFYYDKNNTLLYNFDLNNNFWFKTDSFYVNSTTVYPKSTHLAIYNLLYYTFNFAKHKQYNKIHCIEYDINLVDNNLFDYVSKKLDENDTVMFHREDGWIYGTYFAFNMNKFPDTHFIYDEKNILETLRNSDSRMTENITPLVLTPNGRTLHLEPISTLDSTGIFQKIDTHSNDKLNWCVPVCDKNSDNLHLFVYNNNGGEYKVDVLNEDKHFQIYNKDKFTWSLTPIGNIQDTNKILIMINDEIKKEILLTSENKEKFKNYNFVEFI